MNNCCCKHIRCCCNKYEPKQVHYALLPNDERHDGKIYFVPESVIPGGVTIMVRNDGAIYIKMNEYRRW